MKGRMSKCMVSVEISATQLQEKQLKKPALVLIFNRTERITKYLVLKNTCSIFQEKGQ